MKIRSFIAVSIALLFVTSCGNNKMTQVTGDFATDSPSKVTISVPGQEEEFPVEVVDGKFSVSVPANLTAQSLLSADNGIKIHFISDGTPINISIQDVRNFTITSKKPKASIQERSTAFKSDLEALSNKYKEMADALGKEKMDSLYDAFEVEYLDLNKKVLKANTSNIIAVTALKNLQYDLPADELQKLVKKLDPALAENTSVANIKKVLDAKLATAEGAKFTDFEVNGTKFSSYVGNGKYMLVDFWASWCAPCKAEIPNIKNVYEKYAGKDFDVLSVAVWDKPQATIDTAKVYGIEWNQIIDAQKIPTDIYGIQGIPHIILFGPDGTILKRDLREEGIEAEVAKYVQPKN